MRVSARFGAVSDEKYRYECSTKSYNQNLYHQTIIKIQHNIYIQLRNDIFI